MENYFVRNRETGKLELHFDKATYAGLSDAQKSEIKSAFLWGRNSGCWISRAKEPNTWKAQKIAESLGLEDAGKEGDRMSFAEQMERKQQRAERRADRYEGRADIAERTGEQLQAPINSRRGDTAFFTQPNINTAAGRAFARRRERMFAAYECGFAEFRKSEYWRERAETARKTAAGKELQDKGFVMRRINECESNARSLKKSYDQQKRTLDRLEAGEELKNWRGEPISLEAAAESLENWAERLEAELDKLGFYQDILDSLGGVTFSKENLKKGDLIIIPRWGKVRFVRGGPKNFTFEFLQPHMTYADGSPMRGQAAYAEITERAQA